MNVLGARRLRRLDHGPRRLRPLRLVRQQLRHRQRRRGPQGRDAGGRRRRPASRRCTCTARRRAAIRAGAYAQAQPASVDRLVLSAFTYKGKGSAEIARRRKRIDELPRQPAPQARRRHDPLDLHPRRPCLGLRSGGGRGDHRGRDEIRRHHPERHLSRHGGQPAAGRSEEGAVAGADGPRRRYDGNSTNEDLLDFYTQLPNGDRQFVILPQTAHSLGYSKNRHLLWYAVRNFLAAPAPIAAS